jgi:cyanophycinase
MKKYFVALTAFVLITTIKSFAQSNLVQTVGPEKGALVIVGGGKVGPEIWDRFIQLAGGKEKANIIVVPTAGDDSSIAKDGDRTVKTLKGLGIQNVTLLHTRDPKDANKESFIAPLKKATAVWFDGGRQWRIADAFLNTLAHKEFNAILNRGGVIGGTSAGASILGSFLLRGDTKGNTTLIGDHTEGLDFIHGVTIDQHILRRNRQFDLIEVIKTHPELLGIGIDESTAVVVQQNAFEVIGASYAAVYYDTQIAGTQKSPTGDFVTTGPFYFLGKGQKFDLKERRIIAASTQSNTTATAASK